MCVCVFFHSITNNIFHCLRAGIHSTEFDKPLTMSRDSDPYIFTTDTLPSDHRFLPPLANGLLGWRVYNSIMHMGGVYNGEGGRCHRADVPCPLAVKVETEEPAQHTYGLDTHTGRVCSVWLSCSCCEHFS